jgi:hypothetical protein
MSDQKGDKWEMPKPVFRTSTGELPKSFEETISQQPTHDDLRAQDDEDILSINELPTEPGIRVDDGEVLLEDMPTEPANREVEMSENPVDDHAVPADRDEAIKAEEQAIVETEPKRSTFLSFTTIFLLIVVIAAAVVIGLFYYLSRRPPDGNF